MKKTIFIFTLLLNSIASAAEPTNKLDFLYGQWEGLSNKAGVARKSYECNYPKLNGKIGIIEAKYVEIESKVEHIEFGTFAPIKNSDQYKFTLLRNDADELVAIGTMDSVRQIGTLELSVPHPQAGQPPILVKYIATISGKSWHEVGERSMDSGKTWIPFYEMNLTKVSETCEKIGSAYISDSSKAVH